jgi:signal transduction histidine kinase
MDKQSTMKFFRSPYTIMVLAWTMVGFLLGTQAWVARSVRGEPIALLQTLMIWLAWSYLWALFTPVVLSLLRRFPFIKPRVRQHFVIHLIASTVIAIIDLAAYAVVAPFVGAMSVGINWWATFSQLLGTTVLLNVPVYWLIIGIAQVANVMALHRERERRETELKAQLSELSLQALKAQLQPHFLFNALNTIGVLMREDVNSAHQVLLQLSRLLRRALENNRGQLIGLSEEISFLETYLALEKIRFQERLHYQIEIADNLDQVQVPAFLLQTLVENAVRHGLAERQREGHIIIAAQREAGMLRLTIEDNGKGFSQLNASLSNHEGLGLTNTKARLALLYGDRSHFDIQSSPDNGTMVTIRLPIVLNSLGTEKEGAS